MKKFFNKGLFIEALRQTQLATIIFICLYLIRGLYLISEKKFINTSNIIGDSFIPLVYSIILTIVVFSFVVKNKNRDFYGVLPISPIERFITLSASILVQMIGSLLLSFTLLYIALICFDYEQIIFKELLINYGFITSICILVAGGTCAGIMFTKRKGVAIFGGLSLIYLFNVVRISFLSRKTIVLKSAFASSIYNPGSLNDALLGYIPIFVLQGVLLFLLGYILFKKFGYEKQHKKITQLIFITLLGATIPISFVGIAYDELRDYLLNDTVLLILSISSIIITIVAHIISTKSLKNIRLILMSIILNFAVTLLTVVLLSTTFWINTAWAKHIKVTSVSLKPILIANPLYSNSTDTMKTYQQISIENVHFTDSNILDLVDENLKDKNNSNKEKRLSIAVKTNSSLKGSAQLKLTEAEFTELLEFITNNETFKKKYYKLEKPSKKMEIHSRAKNSLLTNEERASLYQCLYEEFDNLLLEEKKEIIGSDYFAPYSSKTTCTPNQAMIFVFNKKGGVKYVSCYLISSDITPKTYALYKQFTTN